MSKTDFSGESYAAAGVSIKAQNEVNTEVARRLKAMGMKADGLFGGAVDVSKFKGPYKKCLNIVGASLCYEGNLTAKEMGTATTREVFEKSWDFAGDAIGTLDYIASLEMNEFVPDFVEGVAIASAEHGCPVLGGESAQMKDTYRDGKKDAFVHVVTLGDQPGIDITYLINRMERPLVVATTDGTGTKTKKIRNPEDIIYHGFNDLGAQGVMPIAFALYIAGNVDPKELEIIDARAKSISKELYVKKLDSLVHWKGNVYLENEVDIAGTVVGVIDHKNLITGADVGPGDAIIGIQVDGLMTNGYSLARKLCGKLIETGDAASWDAPLDALGGKSLLHEITLPHRPMTDILFGYEGVEGVLSRFHFKGISHITGGGQPDNMIRMVPDSCKVVVQKNVLEVPPLMKLFREYGLSEEELYSTFNMGVGYTLTVPKEIANRVINYINENFKNRIPGVERKAAIIGTIEPRMPSEPKFEFAN